jgi:hypothetical protein
MGADFPSIFSPDERVRRSVFGSLIALSKEAANGMHERGSGEKI